MSFLALLGVVDGEPSRTKPDLSIEDRRQHDKQTPCIAIQAYQKSAFYYMFNGGNDQALLNCSGVDHKVFQKLLQLFQPAFESFVPCHWTGRICPIRRKASGKPIVCKRSINALGCLGLLLYLFLCQTIVAVVFVSVSNKRILCQGNFLGLWIDFHSYLYVVEILLLDSSLCSADQAIYKGTRTNQR